MNLICKRWRELGVGSRVAHLADFGENQSLAPSKRVIPADALRSDRFADSGFVLFVGRRYRRRAGATLAARSRWIAAIAFSRQVAAAARCRVPPCARRGENGVDTSRPRPACHVSCCCRAWTVPASSCVNSPTYSRHSDRSRSCAIPLTVRAITTPCVRNSPRRRISIATAWCLPNPSPAPSVSRWRRVPRCRRARSS